MGSPEYCLLLCITYIFQQGEPIPHRDEGLILSPSKSQFLFFEPMLNQGDYAMLVPVIFLKSILYKFQQIKWVIVNNTTCIQHTIVKDKLLCENFHLCTELLSYNAHKCTTYSTSRNLVSRVLHLTTLSFR